MSRQSWPASMRFGGPGRRRPLPSAVVLLIVVVLALLRAVLPQAPHGEEAISGEMVAVKRVVDGDTLLLQSGERVRLLGIDTPETKRPDLPVDPLGLEAAQFVTELIGENPVRLEFDRERRDDYQRLLAYVFLPDGRLLNEEIIRAGFSEAKTRYPYRNDRKRLFRAAEEAARAGGRGMWAPEPTSKPGRSETPHATEAGSR